MDNFRGGWPILPSLIGMTERWQVPGYDVLELVGFGRTGELWRGRQRSSGQLIALRRLVDPDPTVLAAVRRQATVVRSLPSAHLVRLRGVVGDALVLDHADGGSLAAVLSRRGRLEPGEVVTTVAPLAQALAEAHAHGLVHGHVGLGSVLLTADGRPLLDDLGLAVLRDQGDALDPSGGLAGAADVWALGALAHELLTGEPYTPGAELGSTVPTPLARTVATAVAFDATSRPDAATFASSLLAACPPLPVRGVPAAPPAGPALPAHRRPGRRVLLGTVAGLAVVLGVVATGWWWGRGAVERPARVQAVAAPDWAAVLAGLDATRGRAFADGDVRPLAAVYAPGSPMLRADADLVHQLTVVGRRAVGLRHRVDAVRPVEVAASSVRLRVSEGLTSYAITDLAGHPIERRPAAGLASHDLLLRRGPAGWQVESVSAPSETRLQG